MPLKGILKAFKNMIVSKQLFLMETSE